MLLQAEFLATAKGPPPLLTVGTVVRLADGLDACGPLRAGQTAIIIHVHEEYQGSPEPSRYRVRKVDGEEEYYCFSMYNVVQVDEAAAAAFLAEESALREAKEAARRSAIIAVDSFYWDEQGEEAMVGASSLLDAEYAAKCSTVRIGFNWNDQVSTNSHARKHTQ
jgi:hypothetical protein